MLLHLELSMSARQFHGLASIALPLILGVDSMGRTAADADGAAADDVPVIAIPMAAGH
jgi:hypothetical protein